MALSNTVVSQFAKLNVPKEEPKETTLNGVYKKMNGVEYVKIDGSDIYTPVTSTVYAEDGERVKVMLKEHTATVIGNITSPSARTKDVNELSAEVDQYGNTIQQLDNVIQQQGNSIVQINNNINQQNNIINQHGNAINQQGDIITSIGNQINQQGNIINSMNNTISQHSDNITSMNNTITQQNNDILLMDNVIRQQGNQITQHSNQIIQQGNIIEQYGDNITSINNRINQQNDTIESMNNTIVMQGNVIRQQGNTITEHNADITILNSGFTIVDGRITGLSSAVIDELETNTLNAEYAKIDFANINTAAVTKIFSDSGIIRNLEVQNEHITGELVGVTIKGDLIEANTLVADKLVVHGSDGLFYKLNVAGETVEAEQTNENCLNGQVIAAHSITAEKITVDDLVAFGATIGGFLINQNSIYSIGKTTVNAPTDGLYLGSDGQIAIGSDNGNHIKYYKDNNDNYVLDVRLDKLYLGAESKSADQWFKSYVELTSNGLRSTFTSTGGSNLLLNSVGLSKTTTNGFDFWSVSGSVTGESIASMSESGHGFKMTGSSVMSQTYKTLIGETYSVSFSYKLTKSSQSATGSVTIELIGQNNVLSVFDSNEETNDFIKYRIEEEIQNPDDPENPDTIETVFNYEATTTSPQIKITCPTDFIFEITDLIISRGINDVWTQYEGEQYGSNYNLDENGLKVYGEGANYYTHTTNDGYVLKTRNFSNNESSDVINAQLSKDRV